MLYFRTLAIGALFAALLTGCSRHNSLLPMPPSYASKTAGSLHSSSQGGNGTLYVASTGYPGAVFVYQTPTLSLIRTVTENVEVPLYVALGLRNRLLVANYSHDYDAVNVYAWKGGKFLKTISHLHGPEQVAMDLLGRVYVRRYNKINVYYKGKMHAIKVSSLFMALDPSNNLYVATGKNTVNVYAPGGKTPTRTITDGIAEAHRLAFDTAGNLYVANSGSNTGPGCGTDPGSVAVFAPGGSSPTFTISGAQGACQPYSLAFDGAGDLYVGNVSKDGGPASNITVYAPHSGTLLRTITDGVNAPWSLALDKAGYLYVANRFINTVTTYLPNSTTLGQTLNIYSPESLVIGK